MKKSTWIDRTLVKAHYRICLVLNQEQLHRELRKCKIPVEDWPNKYASKGGAACVFYDDELYCFVMVNFSKKSTIEERYSMLCHEAVHVFQWNCAKIGEHDPSAEFEAYSIQAIAHNLMVAYRNLTSA